MSQPNRLKDDAAAIWRSGVAAVDARRLVNDAVAWSKDEIRIGTEMFPIPEIDRIVVVGFGKASGAMAAGFEQALGERLFDTFDVSGLVNVPDDQAVEKTHAIVVQGCRPAGENLPTQQVLEGTEKIIDLVGSAGPNDICVCLISGGGSALLEKPVDSVSLAQLRETTAFLSNAGASIYEVNAVRRVISQVKGGGLALLSNGAPVVSLILSDVVGDDLEVIASGPTALPTGNHSALSVLKKYDANCQQVAKTVWSVAEAQADCKSKVPYGLEVTNCVIGNIENAMQAATLKATELGYEVTLAEPDGNEGDARSVGKLVAKQLCTPNEDARPVCQIMGGETTAVLNEHPGKGGRNQHLVASALLSLLECSLESDHQFCLLSGGTDGEDGNTRAAGACFDSQWIGSLPENQRPKIVEELKSAMESCDSHRFLSKHDLLFQALDTNTNVCDLRIVLRGPSAR